MYPHNTNNDTDNDETSKSKTDKITMIIIIIIIMDTYSRMQANGRTDGRTVCPGGGSVLAPSARGDLS